MKRNKKRIIIVIAILLIVILGALAAGILYLRASKSSSQKSQMQQFPFGNMQGSGSMFSVTEDMVAASGVTSVGVTEESFDVEDLTVVLKIEEVYVNSEETIIEGTKVLKLSEESISQAREELEQTLKEAELAYRAGVIEYEKSKITAEYDRDSTILEGEQAKAVYDETMSGLTSSVERAKEELNQAKEDIAGYQSYVNDNSYRSYFKVDEYQAIYNETLKALTEKMEEWGVSWPQVTGQGGGSMGNVSSGSGIGNGEMPMTVSAVNEEIPSDTVPEDDGIQNAGPTSDQIWVCASMYDMLEVQRKNLDQAESDYQDALANASLQLQTLELQLPELENAVSEAEKNYKNQVLQAELTYQTSLTNAQSAESDYEITMEQAQNTYDSLQKDWEDAKENLELFESRVGDGYFYASGNGTILRLIARAGQNLSSEGTVFMYSNPEEMTVTVSVDQSNIFQIGLDDSVYIQSDEFGGFEGIVSEVNPVSNSESRTNVTYAVTVQFSGNTSGIGANESVTVVFGMDSETIQSMISMSQGTMSEGERPQGGEMPEGFNPGEMPQSGGFGQGTGGKQ